MECPNLPVTLAHKQLTWTDSTWRTDDRCSQLLNPLFVLLDHQGTTPCNASLQIRLSRRPCSTKLSGEIRAFPGANRPCTMRNRVAVHSLSMDLVFMHSVIRNGPWGICFLVCQVEVQPRVDTWSRFPHLVTCPSPTWRLGRCPRVQVCLPRGTAMGLVDGRPPTHLVSPVT